MFSVALEELMGLEGLKYMTENLCGDGGRTVFSRQRCYVALY